jgi:hypothetical protein
LRAVDLSRLALGNARFRALAAKLDLATKSATTIFQAVLERS